MTQNFEPRLTQAESRLDRVEQFLENLAVSLTAEREQRLFWKSQTFQVFERKPKEQQQSA